MMLAHFLWDATPAGETSDETHWLEARETALVQAAGYLGATWRGWPSNERRASLALATVPDGPYSAAAQARVGIGKSSLRYALEALANRADTMQRDRAPILTDPLLELWLQRHGAADGSVSGEAGTR